MKIEKIITIINYLSMKLGSLDKLKIVKLLYYIDKIHLRKYGRFVTNDTYLKLKHGPVPTRILNIINEFEDLFEDEKKYIKKYINIDLNSKNRTITSKKEPDLLELSKSELNIINEVIKKYGQYNGSQLRNLTHKEYAYKQASESGKISKRNLIYDLPDDQKKELLVHIKDEHETNEFFVELCN